MFPSIVQITLELSSQKTVSQPFQKRNWDCNKVVWKPRFRSFTLELWKETIPCKTRHIEYTGSKKIVGQIASNRPLAGLWECSQSGVQNKNFLQKRKFLLFCPPDWLHSHRRARGLNGLHFNWVHNLFYTKRSVYTKQKMVWLVYIPSNAWNGWKKPKQDWIHVASPRSLCSRRFIQ